MFQFDRRGFVALAHLEEIALPPDEVALTIQILARRLALLPTELLLLLLDPAQFGDRKNANCIEGHTRRGRNADLASRGIDAEVDVLDVLQDHFHRYLTELKLGHHQYSFCALMMRKMRSTSAASCNTPYNAALMTRSLG